MHADVPHQQAADPVGTRPARLGRAGLDRLGAASHPGRRLAGQRLPAGVPGAARAEEQAHLDLMLAAELGQLIELVIGQEHDPGALGDAVNAHIARGRLLQHRPQDDRTLDAGDLQVVRAAVREAMGRGRPRPRGGLDPGGTQPAAELLAAHQPVTNW